MSFKLTWGPFGEEFYSNIKKELNKTLNSGGPIPNIADPLTVYDFNLGDTAPELTLLEVADASKEKFKFLFKVLYQGNGYLELRTKVQANPVYLGTSLSVSKREKQFLSRMNFGTAGKPHIMPLSVMIKDIIFDGELSFTVINNKTMEAFFVTDPLKKVNICTSFDEFPAAANFVKQLVEAELRNFIMKEFPALVSTITVPSSPQPTTSLTSSSSLSSSSAPPLSLSTSLSSSSSSSPSSSSQTDNSISINPQLLNSPNLSQLQQNNNNQQQQQQQQQQYLLNQPFGDENTNNSSTNNNNNNNNIENILNSNKSTFNRINNRKKSSLDNIGDDFDSNLIYPVSIHEEIYAINSQCNNVKLAILVIDDKNFEAPTPVIENPVVSSSVLFHQFSKTLFSVTYSFLQGTQNVHFSAIDKLGDRYDSPVLQYYQCLPVPTVIQMVPYLNPFPETYKNLNHNTKSTMAVVKIPELNQPIGDYISCSVSGAPSVSCQVFSVFNDHSTKFVHFNNKFNISNVGEILFTIATGGNSFGTISMPEFIPEDTLLTTQFINTKFNIPNGVSYLRKDGYVSAMFKTQVISNSSPLIYGQFNPSDGSQFLKYNCLPLLGSPQNATYLALDQDSSVSNSFSFSLGMYKNSGVLMDSNYFNVEDSSPSSVLPITGIYANFENTQALDGSGLLSIIANVNGKQNAILTNPSLTYSLSYPFMYGKGNSDLYTFSFSAFYSKYFNDTSKGYIVSEKMASFTSNNPTTLLSDFNPPILTKVELIPVSQFRIKIRVHVVDSDSGVYSISIKQQLCDISISDLVYGTIFDGVFEKECNIASYNQKKPVLVVADSVGNLKEFQYFYSVENEIPNYPVYDFMNQIGTQFTIFDISHFEFESNNIDLSNTEKTNKLFINVTESGRSSPPGLQLSYGFSKGYIFEDEIFTGVWDNTKNMYRIDFKLKARVFTGAIRYSLLLEPYYFYLEELVSVLGDRAVLRVLSTYGDSMPPLITDIKYIGGSSNYLINVGDSISFGWLLTIDDQPNGFNHGQVVVQGEKDLFPYTFIFGPQQRIGGDEFLGIYRIAINQTGNNCVSQDFVITSVVLTDMQGYKSENVADKIDPLFNFYRSESLKLSVACSLPRETEPPLLESFSIDKTTVEVGGSDLDRTVVFNITTKDKGSGISKRNLPVIYLSTTGTNIIQQTATLKNISPDSLTAEYTCTIVIPYAFAASQSILVAIYGIVDNHNNFNGYSSGELKASIPNPFPWKIDVVYSPNPLIISGNTPPLAADNKVTLNGYRFGFKSTLAQVQIDNHDGEGFKEVANNPLEFSNTKIVIDTIDAPKQKCIIRLVSNDLTSNDLILDWSPTPSPSNTPSNTPSTTPSGTPSQTPSQIPSGTPNQCEGNPICGGSENGDCTTNGCVCKGKWIGKDCQSQIIDLEPPIVDDDKPRANSTKDSFRSVISIQSLREISPNGSVVNEFIFNRWLVSNKSDTDALVYHYSTNFTQREQLTFVNATLKWFSKDDTTTKNKQSNSLIGITVRAHKTSSVIDPDFSLILDHRRAKNKEDSVCGNSSLDKGKLAGILIGSVAGAAVIGVSITYHIIQKKKASRVKKQIQTKLKNYNA
eukprot:gene4773-5953_t